MNKQYKKILDKYQKVCDKLNEILENKTEDFIDKLNEIIYNEVYKEGGELYWNRQIYIESNFDEEQCRKKIRSEKVMFEPNEDPEEHPGITMTYKPEFRDPYI